MAIFAKMPVWNRLKLLNCCLVLLLNFQRLHCDPIASPSEVYYTGNVPHNSTQNAVGHVKTKPNLSPQPEKTADAYARDEIASNVSVVKNVTSGDEEHDNTVFFERKTEARNKTLSSAKRNGMFLKSSQANATNDVALGDSLDLASASIVLPRSSPSIVPSCIGNQVTLKCTAEGNPAPDFMWYKGKRPVDHQKVAEFDLNVAPSLFTRASHLTLTPNTKEDFDDYVCTASNTLGSAQHSTHKIRLLDKVLGKGICAQSSDSQKYNSIIIGTVSSVGMLLAMLFVAGFVFWRLNQREAEIQSLKKSNESAASVEECLIEEGHSTEEANDLAGPAFSDQAPEDLENETTIIDDFNAQEIGRLSSLLAADWERLARLLGFHQHDVTAIREGSDRIESRCAEMLNRFRRRHGSRETLIESVEELKDIETALAIRQKYYKHNPTQ